MLLTYASCGCEKVGKMHAYISGVVCGGDDDVAQEAKVDF